MLSPLHIQFMLGFHVSAEPFNFLQPSYDSDAGKSVLAWMEKEGLVDWGSETGKFGTDRLAVFVEHLCAQPLPVWQMPQVEHTKEPSGE